MHIQYGVHLMILIYTHPSHSITWTPFIVTNQSVEEVSDKLLIYAKQEYKQ